MLPNLMKLPTGFALTKQDPKEDPRRGRTQQRIAPKAEGGDLMTAVHVHPRRATRTMYIAFIWTIGNVVMFDLEIKNCPMTFHIAMSKEDRVIQAFTDEDGQLGALLELVGTEATFHFRDFTSNDWIQLTPITRIQKKRGKA